MQMRTIINNATVVNEGRTFKATVVVDGQFIADVVEDGAVEPQEGDEVIDAAGMYLLPGVIDDHVHFREPGLTHKADIAAESRAAAAGGVTSYMEMPNTMPQTTTLEALEDKFRLAAEKSAVNYSFFFGATNDNVDLLQELDKERVCGVKVFMGSSTGNMLVDRVESLRRLFSTSPLLIMTHCEDTTIIEQNIKAFKKRYKGQNDFPVRYHSRIRSAEACFASTSLAVRLAEETGARLHVAHVSTAKELELFGSKPLEQKRITAEACVPHLVFSSEDYDLLDTKIKCNPAIKTTDDREALRNALTNGLIDVVATDHAPHLAEEKVGGALKAVSGMPMVQFSLVSMLQLADEGVLTVDKVVELMSHNPARLFRIDRRGFVRKGYYADLVLVDPKAEWTATNDSCLSKCGWTPMDGRRFNWKVSRTFVNGQTAYADGKAVDSVRGMELRFNA